ncbi:MAG TPA: hypothetical protein ENN73_05305 [Firmicutes bacterium]|nr:hypothetical protein [Bacillota bacterium]
MEKGEEAKSILEDINRGFELNLKIDVFDFAEEEDLVENYVDYFDVTYLPALLFFSEKGVLERKLEFDISREDVLTIIRNINSRG